MSQTSYSVGSAFAEALSQADAMARTDSASRLRPVDFVNVGLYCSEEAHALLQRDPAKARELLIHGASRMLALAEMLPGVIEQAPTADVIPFPRDARPRLAVVS
jgi:hypothetical protein